MVYRGAWNLQSAALTDARIMHMKQALVIMAGTVLLLAAIGILVGAYFFLGTKQPSEETPEPVTSNPFGTLSSGTTVTPTETISLSLADGSTVQIPDFSKTEQPPAASEANGYQVAGAADSRFQIVFFPLDSGFIISLNEEPLGEVRRAAEAALRERLTLSDAELCKLKADVGTVYSVSSTYGGRNLGLSFCPGSVPLP